MRPSMRRALRRTGLGGGLVSLFVLAGCGSSKSPVISILPGPDAQKQAQTALINATKGTIIEFEEGTFDLSAQLSLTNEGVTIRGKGIDKTTLSFKGQNQGSEAILVRANGFTIENLSVEDAKGDAIKVNESTGVVFRGVRAAWTGGPKPTNGAYGIYPVQCKEVLIEDCVAIGASDAGIYVGQSSNIIVRRCRATGNVAGIEIENSTDADVYENVATNNAGGLLVFDLPDLPVKNGARVRVFNNEVFANNHENFAPPGNIVASVPPGTGMMVMATDNVEVFKNKVRDNQTTNLSIISYLFTQRPIKDKEYDPIPEGIYVHDNEFGEGGQNPAGAVGTLLAPLVGKPFPDILYDGIVNQDKLENGQVTSERRVYITNNGDADFINIRLDKIDLKAIAEAAGGTPPTFDRDLAPFKGELPALKPVKLAANLGDSGAASTGGGD